MSRRLKGLERALGQSLFKRGARGVTLTPAGETLKRLTDEAVEALLTAPDRLAEEAGAARIIEVKVTGGQQLLLHLLAPSLLSFQADHPAVRVSTVSALKPEVIAAVRSGAADVGLTSAAQIPEDFAYEEVVNDELRLVLPARHPLAGGRRPTLEDIAAYPLLLPDVHSSTRALIVAAFREAGLELQPGTELQRWEVIREFVARGLGIAIMPSFVAEGLTAVTLRQVQWPFPRRSYGVLTSRTRHVSRPARDLIRLIKAGQPAAEAAPPS